MIENGGLRMNKSTVVVAFLAALGGGTVSRYISPAPVQAQTPTPAPVELRAQRFAFVNSRGGVVATLTVDQPEPPTGFPFSLAPPTIRLLDFSGKEIWSAGGATVRQLAVK